MKISNQLTLRQKGTRGQKADDLSVRCAGMLQRVCVVNLRQKKEQKSKTGRKE